MVEKWLCLVIYSLPSFHSVFSEDILGNTLNGISALLEMLSSQYLATAIIRGVSRTHSNISGGAKVGNGFLSVEYFRTKATLLMFDKILNVPLIMTQLFFLTRVLLKTCFSLIITIKKEDLSYEFIYSLSLINIFIYAIIHFG